MPNAECRNAGSLHRFLTVLTESQPGIDPVPFDAPYGEVSRLTPLDEKGGDVLLPALRAALRAALQAGLILSITAPRLT